MKERTLLADRLYFGLEPDRLRSSAQRVLTRVSGLRREHARISARNLRQDFELTTVEGQVLVGELVAKGLLRERTTSAGHYRPTRRLAEIANARVRPAPVALPRQAVGRQGDRARRRGSTSAGLATRWKSSRSRPLEAT